MLALFVGVTLFFGLVAIWTHDTYELEHWWDYLGQRSIFFVCWVQVWAWIADSGMKHATALAWATVVLGLLFLATPVLSQVLGVPLFPKMDRIVGFVALTSCIFAGVFVLAIHPPDYMRRRMCCSFRKRKDDQEIGESDT